MTNCSLMIKNCTYLKPDMTVSDPCAVAVDGSAIREIGSAGELEKSYRPDAVLDGSGKLMLPGFIDGHTHTCQQLLRGRVADEYPMVWTRFLIPFESNLTPDDAYVSAKLACLEMIKSGTTAFAESGGVHMDRVADAVVESGMRAAIARSTMDTGGEITGIMKETAAEAVANTERLYKAYQGAGNGRIDVWFAIRQVMTCSRELISLVGEAARSYHTHVHMHLCEHRDEVRFCLQNYRRRPAELLDDLGVLGENLLTAHNVLLSDGDIRLMARRGVKVVHCPRSNLGNHGFAKTPQILGAGLSVGLGCDGAAHTNSNLFDEMKALRFSAIAYWGLDTFDPHVMTCPMLLKMATLGGAEALGRGGELGTIEVGKKADFILLDIDQPHITPTQNLVNTIVDAADGHDVTDSVIDGKIVMKDREVLTIDEEKVMAEGCAHLKKILERI